ncbi:MAG: dephospho-CoA kinase [Actinomycetota bacterium]
MLRVGLTGGIGSGKSTVAERFRELGAVVIDADQLAREVVAAGSAGLAAVRRRFGDGVMAPDGSLDRAALGGIVFADARARKDLEAITHPLIRARTRSLVESQGRELIIVHDVPLLVELDLAAAYHLTVVVGADADIRVQRLTGGRGLTEVDARSRIAAQAGDDARRAAADTWLDNNGDVAGLRGQVDALWQERMVGFNQNLMSGSPSRRTDSPTLVASDDSWHSTAARLVSRVTLAMGERALSVDHIGSTSVPGLIAQDVIDLQVGVLELSDADDAGFVRTLADQGFPRSEGEDSTSLRALPWIDDAILRRQRLHESADPGRVVNLHVREINGPGWRYALLFGDWLRAEAGEREAYAALKRKLAHSATTTAEYAEAKGPWLEKAFARADAWAGLTGWSGT